MQLSILDLAIILVFFGVTFFIGVRERKKISLEDYWVNKRSTGTFSLFATVLSSSIGTGSLIALASIAYNTGVVALIISLSGIFYALLFAFIFAPLIKRAGDKFRAYTLPDILEIRYNPPVRVAAGVVNFLVFSLFTAMGFLAGASFVTLITGFNLILTTIIWGLITIVYISIGGLRADIRTDIFQFFVMLVLILVFLPLLIFKAGGISSLSVLPSNYFTGTAFGGPWVLIAGFLFLGITVLTGADFWQRAFAGSNEKTVKKGMFWAGLFMFPFLLTGVAMGMFGKVLFPNISDPNVLLSQEISLLPIGLLGLVIAGFYAALLSSADTSILISGQTLVRDFYQSFFRKKATEEQILRVSRFTTFFIGIIILAIALISKSIYNLALGGVSLSIVLLPAILGTFFWKKATAKAALSSIIIGTITVFAVLPFATEYAFIPGFLLALISFIVISLLTKHSITEQMLSE